MTTNTTKLLIVDDLPENLRALSKIIEGEDREIFQAASGEQALSLLLEHEFALAILDVMMPEMNGFELAELMRGTERTRHTPIVFVSASGRELNYIFKGYETGAVDFLYKPLDVAAVKSKVNVFVSLYQQRAQVKRQVQELERSRNELRTAQIELERAVKMRDDFMSLVGHELRTPLNTLHVETQVRQIQLEKGNMAAFTQEKLQEMIARDGRQIQSMIRLINDMNDVAQIKNDKLSIRPAETNLSLLVSRVVEDLSLQAKTADTHFISQITEDVIGFWDEFRIEQIIINLLTNAMRYGGTQAIELTLTTQDKYAYLSVRDHGAGISREEQQRIFEKFERGENKKVCAGLGMGLYIARQLAEAHHGSLTVESTPGEGANFILRLPLD
ncbi:MAG: hybrid sensor histidine kinase/response regulator [Cellvibrio sp.]